jgi:hypothetical protein
MSITSMALSADELKQVLNRQPTVDLWPVAGEALGLTRGGTYEARKRGHIPTTPGGPPYRVSSMFLKRALGWEE